MLLISREWREANAVASVSVSFDHQVVHDQSVTPPARLSLLQSPRAVNVLDSFTPVGL